MWHIARAEAGEGEDGRMKSAIGIGALLMDGLGDTIRWAAAAASVAVICRHGVGRLVWFGGNRRHALFALMLVAGA